MPYGKLTSDNFAVENYFLFDGIKIARDQRSTALLALEKIHSG